MLGRDLIDDVETDEVERFRGALARGDIVEARRRCETVVASGEEDGRWPATSMFEELGLTLARLDRFDEAIESFERALEIGWDVVPDARCEIARVLLLAGRHADADAQWARLRAADADGPWTLNAGGMAYLEAGRDNRALEWLTAALRIELDRDDAERIVDKLSDARRLARERLGLGRDGLDDEVDAFRDRRAEREQARIDELRAAARRAGPPVGGRAISVAWLAREAHDAARERWPGWSAGLRRDASFERLAARMERHLRARRADGDGTVTIVTIDLDAYAKWCEAAGHAPDDRRSRGTYVNELAAAGEGRRWPPGATRRAGAWRPQVQALLRDACRVRRRRRRRSSAPGSRHGVALARRRR